MVKHQDQTKQEAIATPKCKGQGEGGGAPEPVCGALGQRINTSSSLSPHPLVTYQFLLLTQTKRKPKFMGTVWA